MYKILVTTNYSGASGASVHTLVLEYEDEDAADLAVERINNNKNGWVYQTALKLY